MIYWHMQMNQPWGRDGGIIDSTELLNLDDSVIGTGEWDDVQCRYFTGEDNRALEIGDFVLVREGKKPLAICEVTSDCFQNDELMKKFHHENYRTVDVLGWVNENEKFPQVLGTLQRLTDSGTDSWKLINKWHKEILKKQYMERYTNILKNLKPQMILQGPPGTGKTYTAKEIAYSMIFDKNISSEKKKKEDDMKLLEDTGQYKLIQFHPAYSYEDFVRGIVSKINIHNQVEFKVENKTLAEFAQKALENPLAKYVLIIDEINRANLPAVLGELIYALEYRFDDENPGGTTVESMYALKANENDVEGDRSLRLPINLYIIGTMNTADRSVGHIDYAIRRRFAFVNFPPRKSVINEVISDVSVKQKANELYDKVETLFNSPTLASDFNKNDVQIGHSYFLAKTLDELNLKTNYEIKPILKEYLKDGILLSKFDSKGIDLTLQFIEEL